MNNVLKKIETLLSQNLYPKKIQERLENDIETLYQRLLTGQYEYHDYSKKNIFRVDERTQDFFLYLKSYAEAGKLWEKILQNIEIHTHSSVVDMCCGWAPKMTLGLFYAQYSGKVVLLDKDAKALEDLQSFMLSVFRPSYTLETLCMELQDKPDEKYSCVIANHIIDDLLLDSYCREKHLDTSQLYCDELYLKKIWREIEQDTDFLEEIPKEFANTLDAFIIKGGVICLSQYESMMENILKNSLSVKISSEILALTTEKMMQLGYKDISTKALKGIANISPNEYIILQK